MQKATEVEKMSLINEILTKSRKYLPDSIELMTQTLYSDEAMPEKCPDCNKRLSEFYTRESEDLIVLECTTCRKFFLLRILEYDEFEAVLEPDYEPDESVTANASKNIMKSNAKAQNYPLQSPIRKRDPKHLSKNISQAYEKSTAHYGQDRLLLDRALSGKLPDLYKSGLSIATINFAKNQAVRYLDTEKSGSRRKLSQKFYLRLLAGALYFVANSTTIESSLRKYKGEGTTLQTVEGIFGVSQPTIIRYSHKFSKRATMPSSDQRL